MRVIESEGLGKRYWLGDHATAYSTLGETLTGLLSRRRGVAERDELWALRNVTFAVDQGETLGIVGRNGAGKSTLLKILARITDPTEGRARIRGRVGALLEVGTAFHPELTGRENIEINGALLGMRRADIRRRFDEIVVFAGVERFLDTPLKRYSSGMYLRLAFAVAAHFEPDVVVVDEVLATGDAEFQHRCVGKMSELGREGRTVVFVSHDLGAIGQLCTRALWIDQGGVRLDGPAQEVLDRYLRTAVAQAARVELPLDPDAPAQVLELGLTDADGEPLETLARGEALGLRAVVDVREPLTGLDAAFWIVDRNGARIVDVRFTDAPENGGRLEALGVHELRLVLPPLLPPGEYLVGAWLGTDERDFYYHEALALSVVAQPHDRNELLQRRRVVDPAVRWEATLQGARAR